MNKHTYPIRHKTKRTVVPGAFFGLDQRQVCNFRSSYKFIKTPLRSLLNIFWRPCTTVGWLASKIVEGLYLGDFVHTTYYY